MTRVRFAVAGLAVVAVVSGCGASPGTEPEFAELLMREGSISQEQADCIAGGLFEEYGDDEELLGRLSYTAYDDLVDGEESIEGFEDFYDTLLRSCLR